MFMVTRRDMGELTFFMSQPAAIAVESLVQWGFSRVRSRTAGPDNNQPALSRYAGYIWSMIVRFANENIEWQLW